MIGRRGSYPAERGVKEERERRGRENILARFGSAMWRITTRPTRRYLILLCLYLIIAINSEGSAVHAWQLTRDNNNRPLAMHSRQSVVNIIPWRYQEGIQQQTMIKNSSDDNFSNDDEGRVKTEDDINDEVFDDPDGVPLFDTNERATFFGLEPNEELGDPLDNGLQFTGPIILFLSTYVTLSLFFPGDVPPPDL